MLAQRLGFLRQITCVRFSQGGCWHRLEDRKISAVAVPKRIRESSAEGKPWSLLSWIGFAILGLLGCSGPSWKKRHESLITTWPCIGTGCWKELWWAGYRSSTVCGEGSPPPRRFRKDLDSTAGWSCQEGFRTAPGCGSSLPNDPSLVSLGDFLNFCRPRFPFCA